MQGNEEVCVCSMSGREKATAADGKNQILAMISKATGMHAPRIRTVTVY